jgi:hypothetical protein
MDPLSTMAPVCGAPGCGQRLEELIFRCYCGDPAWCVTSGNPKSVKPGHGMDCKGSEISLDFGQFGSWPPIVEPALRCVLGSFIFYKFLVLAQIWSASCISF